MRLRGSGGRLVAAQANGPGDSPLEEPVVSRRSRRKLAVVGFLRNYDLEGLLAWSRKEPSATAVLLSILFNDDELLRWRTIEALGRVAGEAAVQAPDGVRDLIRRLLWLMNDESGGLLWQGPEVIAEILSNAPDLLEEPFERGSAWALARLAGERPELWRDRVGHILPALTDPDPFLRAHAAAALGPLGEEAVHRLRSDLASISVYDRGMGNLVETSVGALVEASLAPTLGGDGEMPRCGAGDPGESTEQTGVASCCRSGTRAAVKRS